MNFGFRKRQVEGRQIPMVYAMPYPEAPPPTFREALKELYNKHDQRITSVEAYKLIGRPNTIPWAQFHEEWEEMKKEEKDDGWVQYERS